MRCFSLPGKRLTNAMAWIHVVGVGLDGAAGLTVPVQAQIAAATLLVGSDRQLQYFPDHPAPRVRLGELSAAIAQIRQHHAHNPTASVVILTSGDPLFFGLGRLLLLEFSPEALHFHPHLSSVQLAFNRVKIPWQDAQIVSVHGRSLDPLIPLLQQGKSPIAVLTDPVHSPAAIAALLLSLDLPRSYVLWVCENLGGTDEHIQAYRDRPSLETLTTQPCAPLNVVILHQAEPDALPPDLPALGIPDRAFLSFPDRPGLMTKREIRPLILAELAIAPNQVIWDIGAGTGSVAIELARLCPTAQIYAIEQTAVGHALIQQNCQRFQITTVQPILGAAPSALADLPAPDRIFIGGSGGQLVDILQTCGDRLAPHGRIVLALATLEHLAHTLTWLEQPPQRDRWQHQALQIHLSRSVPIAHLTRWAPLNPVTLVTLSDRPDPPSSRRVGIAHP